MASIKAVLFDFGGTLYDYKILGAAERESLMDLVRWAGVDAGPGPVEVQKAYRKSLKRVFYDYLPKRFYLHSDFFSDALSGMLDEFGAKTAPEYLVRFRALLWERYARDLDLREGVLETLIELKKRGLYLGLVSNIDEDQLEYLSNIAKIGPYFDFLLSSEYAKSCKPDQGIFSEAIRRAGCRPGEALFVGDSLAQDIAGANQAGLCSVLLWHREDLEPPQSEPQPRHVIRRIPEVLSLM
ncbi:MAG: HAD family hydrolase [Deltaproteobacteria bacterium]|nr:HAD family hydrolase [Deltaproteobacteria bacterium]